MEGIELLKDPCSDRLVKQVPLPPSKSLKSELLWKNGLPDWNFLKEFFHKEGRIQKKDCLEIINKAYKLFRKEPNLLALTDPVTVVGDIHGQYYDLLRMFISGGDPANTKYLFLGDYVDRGSFSVEVIILLYCLKINFPDTVYMLRGNHECRQMTQFFNFRTEVIIKFDQETYERIMESFDIMPLACLVNGKFLAVHGGISPDLHSLDDINNLQRNVEPPKNGLFCDILWADPVDNEEGISEQSFYFNDVRGCS